MKPSSSLTVTPAATFRSAALLTALVLAGCGGSGVETTVNPVTSAPPPATYSGPPPATADVQSFKVNVWDNVQDKTCGDCHNESNGQAPMFVRRDDINLAYEAANSVVDLQAPEESRLVTKVAGGHNCWLGSDAACADLLTTWISNWAGEAGGGGGRQIELKPPPIRDPGASRSFPEDSALFATTVWPLVTTYCSDCHTGDAGVPVGPYFASADVDEAYEAVKPKLNLDEPSLSRLVVRLGEEFHNCWSDCQADAAEMQGAIEAFANQISPTEIDPTLVVSKALTLYDGTVASGGNRYDNAAIAMYEFKTGQGTVAYDTSGVEPSLDLNLSGDVTWVGGWGLNLRGGKAQGSTSASKKLHDLIKATGEYSVEAWVAPANVVQEEAHIVGYSAGTMARNFTLGQTMYDYDFFHRSTTNDANGDPALSTPSADEILQATLQHVVAVFDPVEGRRIYVNGELVTQVDPVMAGSLTDWDDTFAFVLGNEVSNDRTWEGVIRLVAVHNRVLTEDQIRQNFEAGVGEKFFLLFSVEHLIDVPESYVMFEVAQFDSYGYLFDKATFISLDPNAEPADIPIAGIRIGINGAEASVGQAYRPVDTTLSVANGYDPATGQRLSPVGTVIGLEKGPEYDEFFLSFDVLGDNLNVRTDPAPLTPQTPADRDREADIGLRTFDEINETMATVTGVSPNQADVRATFETVRQALPAVENVNGFLASQQMAVAQLAIEYCNALVEDTGLRSSFFPSVNFGQTAATQQSAIIDPLLDRLMGTNLVSQPDPTEVRTELEALIGRLTNCPGGCEPDRTETVAKAACAAVMGSAVTLVQ